MPVQKLKKFLDDNGVRYVVITHSPAFTAHETAASMHLPGKNLAKVVVVRLVERQGSERMAMAVLPATYQVDLDLLAEATGAMRAELMAEEDFARHFPGCDVGAMPPFGNLYNMDVFVAGALAEDEEIAFNAGSHSECIKMAYADFERIVEPTRLHFETAFA